MILVTDRDGTAETYGSETVEKSAYLRSWWARRRLQKWEDRLADRREHLDKWGFGMKPSERRKAQVGIDRAAAKVAAAAGNDPSVRHDDR